MYLVNLNTRIHRWPDKFYTTQDINFCLSDPMVNEASIRAVCESGVSSVFQVYCFFFHHAILVIKLAMESHVAN